MHCAHKLCDWRAVSWWLSVLLVAVMLKQHYSVATAAELEWMLRPLARLLEWFSGHPFYRDGHAEWVSEAADVRLVKACAGINFLLMSLMAYAWTLRPELRSGSNIPAWLTRRVLLLCVVLAAAWVTGLLANSLRIIVAMSIDSHRADLHRFIGLAIYVPLLSLQLTLGKRSNSKVVFTGPVLLYLLMMVAVPLLTGNALVHTALFMQHLLTLLMMFVIMGAGFLLWQHAGRLKPLEQQLYPAEVKTYFSLRHYAAHFCRRFLIIRNNDRFFLCKPVGRETGTRDCPDRF